MRADHEALAGAFAALVEVPDRIDRLEAQGRELRALLAQIAARLPPVMGNKADAARSLGVSLSSIDRMIATGQIAATKIGRAVRIDMAALAALRPADEETVAVMALRAREGG